MKEDEFGAFIKRGSPENAPKKEKTAPRVLLERCFLLEITANRSRLVRRDLRELFYFLRKQNRVFAPAHPVCREALAGKVNAARVLAVCP